MAFDYFYGDQSDLFAFYRVPKRLFTDPWFHNLSTEGKTLYGILLDRMSLSAKNGWLDEDGRVYIIFTVQEIRESLSCGNKKAIWNGQEKRTPKLLYQATCLRFCVHRKRLTSGGRLSSLAVLRRRRL